MPIFATNCSICGEKVVQGELLFSTWGVFYPREHALWRFCDSIMHWGCYAPWPHRAEFAAKYFEAWTHWTDDNPFWFKALISSDFFVHANPSPPEACAELVLRPTGSRIRIPAVRWEAFVSSGNDPEHRFHLLEENAIREALPELRRLIPRWEDVAAACDSPEGRAKLQRLREEYQQYKQKVRKENDKNRAINAGLRAACETLLPRLQREELGCPKCGHLGKEWRYKTAKGRPHFICRKCGCSFGPSDFPGRK